MKYLLLIFMLITNTFANNSDKVFQELLEKVKAGYKTQTIQDKKREKKFLLDVNTQNKVLLETKKEIKQAKQISQKLKNSIKDNEVKLQNLSNELDLASEDLGELFGTVKQVSSDMNVHIKASLISSQFPQRKEFLKELISKNALPDIKELEKLWYIMFQEIIESGKVIKYKTKIISKEGTQKVENIIRFGNFNAISKNSFLKYNASNSLFVEPSFQPNRKYLSLVKKYFNSNEKISEIAIDPTRGIILDIISQKPNLEQRISQGGIIGYIIICLGIIGLFFAFIKYIWLCLVARKIKKQLKHKNDIKLNNPLGRILKVYNKNKHINEVDLEYKIDEAFYKEVPSLQSGFSMLKLFAATTPLLGLLGTVTGMILTFQSITLFGTSDPKLMAGGISQALITTMLGLIAAIPLLFAHTFLSSKAKKVISILEQTSISLLNKDD
ncbi:MotA/TolQ/ExbB proton channel family protein [Sulfurimonas sp.]|uniref:MotA/TolQ/ExbB proton channel family protein n=1 Tax=Sulfurimonas sp. TaxID=2022749 RepID=UPI002B4A87C7|nr:MotA/TolQ/ExbB proton channel family protein [Sulfurimonas sp.]